jgi:hypothetical protein
MAFNGLSFEQLGSTTTHNQKSNWSLFCGLFADDGKSALIHQPFGV